MVPTLRIFGQTCDSEAYRAINRLRTTFRIIHLLVPRAGFEPAIQFQAKPLPRLLTCRIQVLPQVCDATVGYVS